ncbi:sarcosine oxidase subunit delta [Terasakiella pusilla]|jgi:sarcosine oxidase subunit delta|uniref:sarcosine oxidase subunit delta n=1 Tax=Terasakiella pusilla TaxID=64973 RepID=UPI003AA9CA75
MKIECPFCGKRDHSEFTYKGDATVARPDHSEQDLDRWNDYVFQRTNPKGAHKEYWHHTSGCRKFLIVERDTVSHKINSVTLVQGGGK